MSKSLAGECWVYECKNVGGNFASLLDYSKGFSFVKRLFSLLILLLSFSALSWADESFLPQPKHMKLMQGRKECFIYAAVQKKTYKQWRNKVSAKEKIEALARRNRNQLELCGARLKDSRGNFPEEELATMCPNEYQKWITSGELYVTNQVEVNEAYRQLQSLAGLISYHCGEIPVLPDAVPDSIPAENPN